MQNLFNYLPWWRIVSQAYPQAFRRRAHRIPAGASAVDVKMMRRCIELSRRAIEDGEFPFASLIAKDEIVVAEATNRTVRDRDITRHAELLAVSLAQQALGTTDLSDCTLYSSVEPCAMCSFPIRASRIHRVFFAIPSPLMGGSSRWDLLGDPVVSRRMPEAFGDSPAVFAGFLEDEARRIWLRWNPLIWAVIRARGVFGSAREQVVNTQSDQQRALDSEPDAAPDEAISAPEVSDSDEHSPETLLPMKVAESP